MPQSTMPISRPCIRLEETGSFHLAGGPIARPGYPRRAARPASPATRRGSCDWPRLASVIRGVAIDGVQKRATVIEAAFHQMSFRRVHGVPLPLGILHATSNLGPLPGPPSTPITPVTDDGDATFPRNPPTFCIDHGRFGGIGLPPRTPAGGIIPPDPDPGRTPRFFTAKR
jgi:hypothetical protein